MFMYTVYFEITQYPFSHAIPYCSLFTIENIFSAQLFSFSAKDQSCMQQGHASLRLRSYDTCFELECVYEVRGVTD